MSRIPAPVFEYLAAATVDSRKPAWACVGADGTVAECGGALATYSLGVVKVGSDICEEVMPLAGVFPVEDPSTIAPVLILPRVYVADDRYADIHVFPRDSSYWVVLVDATSEAVAAQNDQQARYDLSLRERRTGRLVDQFIGAEIVKFLTRQSASGTPFRERRDVTMLYVAIKGATVPRDGGQPEVTFDSIDRYLQVIIDAIVNHGGEVERVSDDHVTGLFGLASETGAAANAVTAGVELLRGMAGGSDSALPERYYDVAVTAGMASGAVMLGTVGSRSRRIFRALGYPSELAGTLANRAQSGEIILDSDTYDRLGSKHDGFVVCPMAAETDPADPVTFSLRMAP